jgi:hypothetical protein
MVLMACLFGLIGRKDLGDMEGGGGYPREWAARVERKTLSAYVFIGFFSS